MYLKPYIGRYLGTYCTVDVQNVLPASRDVKQGQHLADWTFKGPAAQTYVWTLRRGYPWADQKVY